MLKRARGDLVQMADKGQFDVLIHGCNCLSIMGAGIAKQIADKWPVVATLDRNFVLSPSKRLGRYSFVYVPTSSGQELRVVNAYTQYGLGRKGQDVFEYAAFRHLLGEFRRILSPLDRIAFPYIGMGLAGGDPKRIIPMLEDFATIHDVTLVSYSDEKKRRDRVAAFNAHYNRRAN